MSPLSKKMFGLLGLILITTGILAPLGSASAKILFEDDAFFAINSGGAVLDANNNNGNSPINLQFGNDGTDANIQYNPTTQDVTLSAPGGDFNFSDDNLTSSGAFLFQNASEFHAREVADEATANCTTLDEIVLDKAENTFYVCTAIGNPGTWTNAASAAAGDLQGAYDADASGAHEILVSAGDGQAVQVRANANGDDLLQLQNSTATNLINFQDLGGNTIDINSLAVDWDAAGAFILDSVADVALGAATDISLGAGDDIIFDDAQLTGTVQVSDTATDWNGTFATDGIVDNINSFTSTANGQGASNVGVEDAADWFTGAQIEAALIEIKNLFGSTTSGTFNFTENNVLTDNDPVYTAFNRLDLKWGDLASTANGEGASLVGIQDAGNHFTGVTVEAALQEIGSKASKNVDTLMFTPEYPNTTVFPDGSNNQGTLQSFYDAAEVMGYYNWTTAALVGTHDMDIRFTFTLPTDFNTTGDFTYRYRTGTVTEADNDVEIRFYNVTDAQECAADLTNGTAGVWATGTLTSVSLNTGCTGATALNAGDRVEVRIKLLDNSGAPDFADVGRVNLNYTK